MARGRSYYGLPFTCSKDRAREVTVEFLQKKGFKAVQQKNEIVWKKGNGWLMAMQFLRTDMMESKIIAQAWIRISFFSEYTLDGFIGGLPKRWLKKTIGELATALENA